MISFLCLNLYKSLFIYRNLLFWLTPYFLGWSAPNPGGASPWVFRSFFPPHPSRTLPHGTLPSRSWKRPKTGLLDSKAMNWLFNLVLVLRIHYFVVAAFKSAFDLDIPKEPLIVDDYEVQQGNSTCWLLCHSEQEVIFNKLHEPPGFLITCCVVPIADIGVVEFSHEDQGLQIQGCSYLHVERRSFYAFLI